MTKLFRPIAILLIGLTAIVFAPYLVCLPWHLAHSPNQQLGNYTVRVPFPYLVTKRGSITTLWRMRTIKSWNLYTFGRLEFTPHNIPLKLSVWSQLAGAEASRNSLIEARQYDFMFGSTLARCQEISPETGKANGSLLCRGADSSLAFYVGDPRNMAEVKQILTTALTNTGGTQ